MESNMSTQEFEMIYQRYRPHSIRLNLNNSIFDMVSSK